MLRRGMAIDALLLALIAIFVAAKFFGELAERLGQPAVLGELLGGVLIGVSGLHLVDPHDVTIHLLSELGVILLLLIFAQIGLSTKLISGGMYSAVALMVMITTFIAPPLLRRLLVPGTPGKMEGGAAEYVVDAPMDRD